MRLYHLVVLIGVYVAGVASGHYDLYNRTVGHLVEDCEKSLPRDQHCVPVYGAKVAK